jgi:hypothetical protein
MMTKYCLLCLLLLLTGCSGGAVVFAPAPLPPDATPRTYTAPGGAFTLVLPPDWSVYEQATAALVSAAFTPPGETAPQVQAVALNLGQPLEPDALLDVVNQYQTQLRPDLERYTEQDRQVMADGSWRMTGIRLLPGGVPQQVNTFLQSRGTLLGLLEVSVPALPGPQQAVQGFINTFSLAEATTLAPAALTALAGAAAVGLEVVNVTPWTAPDGVFFITGEVANHSALPLAGVPVQAVLTADDGSGLAEAVDVVMGHTLPPGSFAPFSLRFGQGQPPAATGYTLRLGGTDLLPALPVIGAEALTWTNETRFSPDGALFIVGQVSNTGAAPVQGLKAVATVFDAAGRVIAAGFSEVAGPPLRPGTATDYSILIPEAGGSPASYIVAVQGLPCAEDC